MTIVQAYFAHIQERNPTINAYVILLKEQALQAAQQAERDLSRGKALGLLHGVPIAVKDLFESLAGVPGTFGGVKPFVKRPRMWLLGKQSFPSEPSISTTHHAWLCWQTPGLPISNNTMEKRTVGIVLHLIN